MTSRLSHFLSAADATGEQLRALIARAREMKADRAARAASSSTMRRSELHAKTVALIFEKPSLRTRASFEVGVHELGGQPLTLYDFEVRLGERETVTDTGRVLARYVHAIVIRTFTQARVEELAATAGVPVVNALTDHEHPCQAAADLLTLTEIFGDLRDLRLAFVGDGNNVAHSLLLAGALTGMDVRLAHPEGYAPDSEVVERARTVAGPSGGRITVTTQPDAAVEGADAVYTDVWASMGQEEEADDRRRAFSPYRVDGELMAGADEDAVFLHCLPAHRGEEVTAEVIDGPRSRVLDQAENRLHVQKALLATLLGG